MFLSFFCFADENSFFFCHSNGLNLFHNGNLFGHATLKGVFIGLDLDGNYDNTSFAFVSNSDSNYESVKWHARNGHVGRERMSRRTKEDLLV